MNQKILISAITNKKMVSFMYGGKSRVGEPHIVGESKEKPQLLFWQTEGSSNSRNPSNWRRFEIEDITYLEILSETFPGSREKGKGAPFDKIFAVVD